MHRFLMFFLVIPLFCSILPSCRQAPVNREAAVVPQDPHLNASLGKLFLAGNKLKPGVHILPSGLQYSIISDGLGPKPKPSDLVTVYYQGRYVDGKIFDSQHFQKHPITIRVSSMIPGWREAIQIMEPGSIWILYIPSDLAYGEKGMPGRIGPNQTLIYYVRLLSVKPG